MTESEFFSILRRIENAVNFIATNKDVDGVLERIGKIQDFLERFGSLEELMKYVERVEKYAFYGKEYLTMDESAFYLGIVKEYALQTDIQR